MARLLPFLLVLLVGLVLSPFVTAAALAPLLRNAEDARQMTWAQLDALFRSGSIEGGIPEGYTYGYAMVNPRYGTGWQVLADSYWGGKHFEVLFPGDPNENCSTAADAGIKGCGGPRGVVTNYLSLLPGDKRTYYQEMPGLVYIGHLKDIHAPLEALQLDAKPSIIVDYRNSGGDELRLVNPAKRIYLGRGTDWSEDYPHVFAYFVLQLSDVPRANELNWVGPAHTRMRDETFEAAGLPGDPDPRLVQVRRVRPGQLRRWSRSRREDQEQEEQGLPAADDP